MLDKIPITYTLKGKQIKGFLSPVPGAAATTWHIMDENNFYRGQVVNGDRGFQFSDQDGYHPELDSYFEGVICSWLDGE